MASPTSDMSLAFKTRQKLAGTASREDKDLRRVVLLCNTYDTFQRRMTEHFCASSNLFAGLDLRAKEAQISCREVAVVDDDDEDDDDWDADSDSDSDEDEEEEEKTPLSSVGDDEDPPPYEIYTLSTDTAETMAKLSIMEIPVEEDEDDLERLQDPTYTVSTVHSGVDTPHEVTQKKSPPRPPLPRRSSRRGRPGMAPSRASYGHHTVSLSAEHARGVMEVH